MLWRPLVDLLGVRWFLARRIAPRPRVAESLEQEPRAVAGLPRAGDAV
jgi:hypothetical protein